MEQDKRELAEPDGDRHGPTVRGAGCPLPSRARVTLGFTSRGVQIKAIGACWDNRCSGDGHFGAPLCPL